MITLKIYSSQQSTQPIDTARITGFLFKHLEQYGDSEADISKAISYSLGENNKPGGLIITAEDESTGELRGVCVVNKTGMSGYIPENILVYIATDKKVRGQGIGKKILRQLIESTDGDIALHCENENPAKHLYEKMGFTSKYIEMRLKK